MFFVTSCGFAAADAYDREKKRDWVFFALAGIAAAYTHYFAFVSVLWIYGFLFLAVVFTKRKKLPAFGLAALISLLAYVPWMKVLKTQIGGVSQNYWIPAIDKEVLLGYLDTLFETDLPYSTQILVFLFGIAFSGKEVIVKTDRISTG